MDAEQEAHAEGSVEDASEHKTLDRAAHLIPIVHYHYVQYDCDDRPNNSVDDFKSFHIHVVFSCFSVCHMILSGVTDVSSRRIIWGAFLFRYT